jgi:hypothetical protein
MIYNLTRKWKRHHRHQNNCKESRRFGGNFQRDWLAAEIQAKMQQFIIEQVG